MAGTAQNDGDSLRKELGRASGEQRIEILHKLIKIDWLNYPDQAMKYANEALEESRKLDDQASISKSLRLIAGVYYYLGDFEVSLDYNFRALEIASIIADSTLIGNCYNNIGLINYNLGSYPIALEYLLKAKRIKEIEGDFSVIATTLNNIGLVYERVSQFDKAREYFSQALEYASDLNVGNQIIYSNNNIAITFLRENDLIRARAHFNEALSLARITGNINWGAVSLRGIGEIMRIERDFDSASYYFHESLTASKEIGDKKGISETYYFFAKLALDQGEFIATKMCLDKSQEMALELKLRQQMLDNLGLYAEAYRKLGDSANEIKYLKDYVSLRDSLYLDIVSRTLEVIPSKLEEENSRLRLAEEQTELQTTIRLYIVIILLVVPLIIILIFSLRLNRRKNRVLIESNEEIQRTQKLLITSEKMASLGLLSAGIGHEINNPLNFIKHGALTLESKLKEDFPESMDQFESYFKAINEGVTRASKVVNSLSHFSRSGSDLDEQCDISGVIDNCLIILNEKFREKIELVKDYQSKTPIVLGSEGGLHQAFINILSNAEQSIEGNGTIKISIIDDGRDLLIKIQDSGKGISEENLSQISDPFFTTKSPGEGTGLGLFITYSIIEQHKGHIRVVSEPNSGTEFIVSLPLSK